MFCQSCGNQLEEGSVFCMNCGAKVVQVRTESEAHVDVGETQGSHVCNSQ